MRDITTVLDEWPFEPGMINVRLIEGADGEPRIQVRLDLGIIQMHTEGRPDGQRPNGFGSLLEYFEARIDDEGPFPFDTDMPEGQGIDAEPDRDPNQLPGDDPDPDDSPDAGFAQGGFDQSAFDAEKDPSSAPDSAATVGPDECRALREEAAQYYHRYVALLVLEDFEGVIRDTTRNLRVADFCRAHAETTEDSMILEQVRPYILMMRARACAGLAIKDDEPKAAVVAVDEGLDALREHYDMIGEDESFADSKEAQILRTMRESLVPQLPVSQKAELRERLQQAIRRENYELAAILRNELRMLGE